MSKKAIKKAVGNWMYNHLCVTKETNRKLKLALQYILIYIVFFLCLIDWDMTLDRLGY